MAKVVQYYTWKDNIHGSVLWLSNVLLLILTIHGLNGNKFMKLGTFMPHHWFIFTTTKRIYIYLEWMK